MNAKEQKYLDELGLISFERMDVFEVLVETLLKKRENIILSGAVGIGKTTVLKILEREKKDEWTFCLFYGRVLLSFSDIKDELRRVLREQGNISDTEKLHDMLGYYKEHEKRVVLILDNAERFASGFMEGLIQYSLKYSALKIIFVLTKKQLILKNKTDKAVDDCYFIEIPALEKKQMEVFLTMMATTPEPLLEEAEIKPKLINQLYMSSKGIPGAIVTKLHKRKTFWFRWRKYIYFLLLLLLGAGGAYHYSSDLKQNKWYKSFFSESSENPKKKFSAKIEPTLLAVNDSIQTNQEALPNLKSDEEGNLREKQQNPVVTSEVTLVNNTVDSLEKNQSAEDTLKNSENEVDFLEEKTPSIIVITQIPPVNNRPDNNAVDRLEKKELPEIMEGKALSKNTPDISQPSLEAVKTNEHTAPTENSHLKQQKINTEPTETVILPSAKKEKPTSTKKTLAVKTKSEKTNKKAKKSEPKFSDDSQWALQKSARKYTLQLMITTKKDALLKVLNKYATLKNQLKYVGVNRNNKQQYLLLYGSFSSVASAQSTVKTLPKQFKAAWPKQFSAIQAEIKKSH